MHDRISSALRPDLRIVSACPEVNLPNMGRGKRRLAIEQIEPLEERLHWSVTQDSNGWTVVNNAGANIIYVDNNAGSDSNPGTLGAPVASLQKAQQLSVSGPNEILLKAGETFTETTSNGLSSWRLSGQSAANPFLLSYYGVGPRPMIYAGSSGTGFYISTAVNYVDILGLQFDANLRDPTLGAVNTSTSIGENKGFEDTGTGGNILVEDCSFNCFGNSGGDNLDIEGAAGPSSLTNVAIRRCVVTNAWTLNPTGSSSGEKAEGLYAYNVSNLSITQCTFDHNGWDSQVSGSVDTGYSHNIYLGPTCYGADVEQNVIAEAAFAGIMDRGGGTIDFNLFIDNAVALSFGSADGVLSTVGGVSGSIIGNVVNVDKAEGQFGSSPLAYGQGFVIANTAASANIPVEYNLFTGDTQNAKPAITLTMATTTTNPSQAVGINNLTIAYNVLNGWRQGIQTDGRFVPGSTGLYALNGLTITHNDFINSTTQEVRHDGGFAPASESWSGDRYFDSVLPQASWITLLSKSLSYSSWASNYDIGATTLTKLPYSDPTRSAATYDTTQGGPSTWQDYVAQSDQLSITDYRPVYMSQAAVSYIDAGFNINSTGPIIGGGGGGGGGGGSSLPGVVTATASASNVNTTSLGATSYTFTVNYADPYSMNTSALNSSNAILVTGPGGFYSTASFVSQASATTDSNFYQHIVVTYAITPPNHAWAKGEDGTYTIALLPNQPIDSSGAYAQDGIVGSFNVDLTNPLAAAVAPKVTAGSSAGSNFNVSYSDASGIDVSTLNSFDIQVTGPAGYSQYAQLINTTASGNTGTVVCTYAITAPAGGWSSASAYTVSLLPGTVADLAGNAVTSGVLAAFSTGSVTGSASISGVVFNDANGNGTLDLRELPLYNVPVFIDLAGTGIFTAGDPVVSTDSNGNYSFTGLLPGRYSVVATDPTGYVPTLPGNGTNVVTLTAGQTVTGQNFGEQVSTVILNSAPPTPPLNPARGAKIGNIRRV